MSCKTETELAICPQTKVTVYDKLFADQAMGVDFGLHSHCLIKFKTLTTDNSTWTQYVIFLFLDPTSVSLSNQYPEPTISTIK